MLNGAGDSMYALMNGGIEVVARVAFAVGLTAIPFLGMWGIALTPLQSGAFLHRMSQSSDFSARLLSTVKPGTRRCEKDSGSCFIVCFLKPVLWTATRLPFFFDYGIP